MAKVPNLTQSQKLRISRLEPQLKKAVRNKDFKTAQNIIYDMREFLAPTGHYTKLAEYKNWLYELALEIGEYGIAESGLIGTRKTVNRNTRVYLESTALLAICCLRMRKYQEAKPYMQEVLQNEKVIKTVHTRMAFHKAVIERFAEESVLFSLKEEGFQSLDINEVHSLAGEVVMLGRDVNDIYLDMGRSVPATTKNILFQVDEYAKNQLPSAERLMLPSPQESIKDEAVGKTFFSSLKRVIYTTLCDSNGDVYKVLHSAGFNVVLDRKFITTAVISSLSSLGIGIKALAVSVVALIVKVGLTFYCEHYKPIGIMETRR